MLAEKKPRVGRLFLKAGLALAAVVLVVGALNYKRLVRVYWAMNLFNADVIEENFRRMDALFDSRVVSGGKDVFEFKYALKDLPASYTFRGAQKNTADFIAHAQATSLVVVKDDTILFEQYFKGNTPSSRAISWSTSKSIVSALFGIALQEGTIKSLEEPVTQYVPLLKKSGYDGVRIKDVLQMSSGIRFNEDYGDFNSDINRMGRAFALSTPLDDFVASLQNERKPGTLNHYVSMDTQVLGMVLTAATGKNLAEYTREKLWQPVGMEASASWLIDGAGMEAAFGGFNAVARDYARFGRLFLKKGLWNGKQIINEEWVKASTTPDSPHLMPGKDSFGYGYQWWIPDSSDGEFLAIGVYGQAIYVNPRYDVVIAKSSAYANYTKDGNDMEKESLEFFRAIAKNI